MRPFRRWPLALIVALVAGCGRRAAPAAGVSAEKSTTAPSREGRLVLVGGNLGSDQDSIYGAILGGRAGAGPVCVLPTASGAPAQAMEAAQAALDARGGDGTATTVFLAQEDAIRARDPEIVGELEHCSGFFFTSGDAFRVTGVLMPRGDTTLAFHAILDRYRHGAVVAATGEAVSALGSIMLANGGSQEALADGVTTVSGAGGLLISPGLGLFRRAILDSRVFAAGRFGRLLVAVLATDSLPVGLGVDEQTALVVDGDRARVLGRSGVVLLDGRSAVKAGPYFGHGVRAALAGAGDRIDLRTFMVTKGAGKKALRSARAMEAVRDPLGPWGALHVMAGLAASATAAASYTVQGAHLRIAEGKGFSAASRGANGLQGEPAGLSAGPFVVDLLPEGQ